MKRERIRLGVLVLATTLVLNIGVVAEASSATPFGASRWREPRVTYVVSGSRYYRNIYATAIRAWNSTGQFRFIQGSNAHHQVTLTTSNSTTGQYHMLAGITFTYGPQKGYYNQAKVLLLTRNLATYHYTTSNQIHVAEHELGHVMGLQHSTARNSVMLADNRYNGISRNDITAVKKRYHTPVGRHS
ncbi:M57 family metalloprotease [Lactiplantibacillus sp. WILCCON 0030]|uniref:M57 family metalloprotease n=1 Tax=Lactiplantibacillus brownii TaxID=3069269 RepID=A0ABU1A5V1_9LACO|nr:M57 family metalloprotease [Lactiplantibacillus brownii]MDQ7936340.1 M57 family metalloprotease [Lactiplantibacillus brownii]